MPASEKYDVVVIGAGISGVYAAKFYLDIHPKAQLVILDRDTCVGGVWNSRRSYDSFWTQWTVGCAEFSDLAMPRPPEADIYYEFFKGKYTTKYLESYVDHHENSGQTLRDRIRFSIEVESLLKTKDGWIVSTTNRNTNSKDRIHTSKLIVASGLASIANMPSLAGKDEYGGDIIHQENFGSSNILSSPTVQNVTVIGGGKSSADMVYSAIKAGKTVSWILKASDTTGPGFFLSPKGKGPYKNAFAIGMTRIAATFTPSFMNGKSWWTHLLHSTSYGVKAMNAFWGTVDAEARKEADFEGRENLQGFEKLAPHSSIFWQNGTGGLLNQADFFETVAKNTKIYCADIVSLKQRKIILSTGDSLDSDVLLCGTGWLPSIQFFTEKQKVDLGLPHLWESETPEQRDHWSKLTNAADKEVTTTFPQLAEAPAYYRREATTTPYRLYRHIAPLPGSDELSEDRSIVFIGQVSVGNYFPVVECQAMWATAYMDKKLQVPSIEEQQKEVALFTAWCRRRYLMKGEKGNNMTFELIGYTDGLLSTLGLKSHQKGWFKGMFGSLVATDFAGLKNEYIEKYGKDLP